MWSRAWTEERVAAGSAGATPKIIAFVQISSLYRVAPDADAITVRCDGAVVEAVILWNCSASAVCGGTCWR